MKCQIKFEYIFTHLFFVIIALIKLTFIIGMVVVILFCPERGYYGLSQTCREKSKEKSRGMKELKKDVGMYSIVNLHAHLRYGLHSVPDLSITCLAVLVAHAAAAVASCQNLE